MSESPFPDLSEQIRLELERITKNRAQLDDDDEEENSIHLCAQLEDNKLTLTSSSLPADWGAGKEIILNGVRFHCVPDHNSRVQPSPSSPSSKKRALEEKAVSNLATVIAHERDHPSVSSMHRRRYSQDLTEQIEDITCGFLAKLTRHGTYADRWCEIDSKNRLFNYWKTRAARGTCPPTSLAISSIVSVQCNANDVKEGKRRNVIGIGGTRFIISSDQGSTTWRAPDPLLAMRWIDGIQELMEHAVDGADLNQGVEGEPISDEVKSGSLQRMNKAGRYKDRWCEVDPKKKTLSYWTKKSHWEAKRAPKGVVNFAEVGAVVWNPEDVRKGKRRSLLSKDGVRFALHFTDQSVQQWRTDNPWEASEWSRMLGSMHCKMLPRTTAVGKA